jgi:hypothetical protein
MMNESAENPPLVATGMKSITEENWRTAAVRPRFAAEIDANPAGNDANAEHHP